MIACLHGCFIQCLQRCLLFIYLPFPPLTDTPLRPLGHKEAESKTKERKGERKDKDREKRKGDEKQQQVSERWR